MNVTATSARQQHPRYAASHGCSRAAKIISCCDIVLQVVAAAAGYSINVTIGHIQ